MSDLTVCVLQNEVSAGTTALQDIQTLPSAQTSHSGCGLLLKQEPRVKSWVVTLSVQSIPQTGVMPCRVLQHMFRLQSQPLESAILDVL